MHVFLAQENLYLIFIDAKSTTPLVVRKSFECPQKIDSYWLLASITCLKDVKMQWRKEKENTSFKQQISNYAKGNYNIAIT